VSQIAFRRFSPFFREFLAARPMQTSVCLGLILFVLVIFLPQNSLYAQSLSETEKNKIETLIKNVGELKDASFIRNGSNYDPSTAVRFLRGKWNANKSSVKSARDFIDKVASRSETSGKPYLIRFKNGKEIQSREFLTEELKKIES
jgi:intein-encoded DNA endonuclease-like protein